jgi:DNA polymerase-3 subunit delta'
MGMQSSVFDRVVEQEKVIQQLKISAANPLHAYFFVGPRGSCRWEAAKGFAALILSDGLGRAEAERVKRLVLRGEHPDLVRVSPQGNQYRDEEVQIVINQALKRLLLLTDFILPMPLLWVVF